ncbi:MaoC family dehydratase N-terminal domain-containing protein [Evansella sp. LMS18]|jgi:acyl dehydratase|uniref:FAS1-like dehydratase domain-containing protein n=1 Tax=Evansella sp. LMS18 TaxID=2924033 RepID=UPI0020D1863E|nr:MaoC family dehydratase N-terminal domain-containing protein [Evansella sp. LMS18]UTR11917.1 MaoC family dehydratase N-terminal domain-containing protein [Evansella sp. LMS18]
MKGMTTLEHLTGSRSMPVKNNIEEGSVKRFAIAIGEPLRVYTDEDYAAKTPHQKIIAPPTFPRTLDYGEIDGLNLPKAGVIHGEQTFYYKRPLYAGDVVYAHCELLSFQLKQSRSGRLGIINIKQYGYEDKDEDNLIFTSLRTLILTEKLLKEAENA